MSTARLGVRLTRTVPSRTNVRGYAKKSDAGKDAGTPKPTSGSAAMEGSEMAKFMQASEEFHSRLDRYESGRDAYTGAYYELNAKQREAVLAYLKAQREALAPVIAQHGKDFTTGAWETIAIMAEAAAAAEGEPIKVAVTGAAGQIGYALLYRIASGGLFGPKVPVSLHLLELPNQLNALNGVVMELRDCAFPTLANVVVTDNAEKAFEGVDYAFLVGAQPRTKGMERGDLLSKNAAIFSAQGKALNKTGKGKDTRVLVVGNPANTNALIASRNAPNIPSANFMAMTRLDHNRGLSQLAEKVNCLVSDIDKFIIWGNHSATQFPDIAHATIKGQSAKELLEPKWLNDTFIPAVQQRGAAIIAARGSSSAASAASAAIDAIRDWHYGTAGKWTSAAIVSNGEYDVEKGIVYSYPVVFNDKKQWEVVKNLPIAADAAARMETTHKELLSERDAIASLLPK